MPFRFLILTLRFLVPPLLSPGWSQEEHKKNMGQKECGDRSTSLSSHDRCKNVWYHHPREVQQKKE
jgi:hypothetical protein